MSDCSTDSPGAVVGNYDRAMPEGLPVGKALPGLENASPFINHSSILSFLLLGF